MELIVLFGILALRILGPRRGGRMPGPLAITVVTALTSRFCDLVFIIAPAVQYSRPQQCDAGAGTSVPVNRRRATCGH